CAFNRRTRDRDRLREPRRQQGAGHPLHLVHRGRRRRFARHRRAGHGAGRGVRDHHPRRPGREDQDGRRGDRLHRAGASQKMTRRVVITGMGTINSLSSDLNGYWHGLLTGKSGVALIEQFDTAAFKVHIGGEVKDFKPELYLDTKTARHLDRFAQFALAASIQAVRDSGLDFARLDPYRAGTIIGSGSGGRNEFKQQPSRYPKDGPGRISPFVIPKMIANAAAGHVSIHFGLCGPNTAISTACASAAHALGDALRAIQHDQADVMVSGGSEAAITPMGLGGFISARALSKRNDDPPAASRPFDRDRDRFILSEGAGIVVLEELEHARRRGAKVYAELLGVGSTADAFHITAPPEDGRGAARAMELALRDARVNPAEVEYANAHGPSTELGDAAQ